MTTTNFIAKPCPSKKGPITKRPNTTIFWGKKKGPNSNQGPTSPNNFLFFKNYGQKLKTDQNWYTLKPNDFQPFQPVSVEIFKNWPIWFSPKNTQNRPNRTNYTPTFLPPPPSLRSPPPQPTEKIWDFSVRTSALPMVSTQNVMVVWAASVSGAIAFCRWNPNPLQPLPNFPSGTTMTPRWSLSNSHEQVLRSLQTCHVHWCPIAK